MMTVVVGVACTLFPIPAALLQPLPHMLWRRRCHAHRFLVLGNRNHDLAGMQMQDRLAKTRSVAVNIAADDRPAHGGRVDAQLMGAASHRLECEPTKTIAAAAHFPVGDGLL